MIVYWYDRNWSVSSFLLVFYDCFDCNANQQHNNGGYAIHQNTCVPRHRLHGIESGVRFEVPENINPMPNEHTKHSADYGVKMVFNLFKVTMTLRSK